MDARRNLKIDPEEPIGCMRELIEKRLEIPLIQMPLIDDVAGATVANGSLRGIAVNIGGDNSNVWVRRMTLAHELGHLLYDSDQQLEKIQVDNYSDIQEDPHELKNYIEARANAFAVEFIAPQKAAERIFRGCNDYSTGLRLVMDHFGLSYTSAKFHIWNACNREMNINELVVEDYEPTSDWEARERFATDFFKPDTAPISRRGRFACLVVQASDANLLSEESAASFLRCEVEDYRTNVSVIRGICDLAD